MFCEILPKINKYQLHTSNYRQNKIKEIGGDNLNNRCT